MLVVHVSSPQEPVGKHAMASGALVGFRRFLEAQVVLLPVTTVAVRSVESFLAPRARESALALGSALADSLEMLGQAVSVAETIPTVAALA